MKKFIICALLSFSVIFCSAYFAVRFANDKIYNLLYPSEKTVTEKDSPRVVTLKNGDYFILGEYNGEPLLWRVVLNGKAQCDKIVEFMQYDANSSEWQKSELREWLNSDDGFFGKALIEKNNIISGEICVLSQSELEKIGDISKQPTLAAIRNSKSKYLFLRKNCWYWTSSAIDTNSHSVATVTQNGGFYKTLSNDNLTGVCPAFTLKSTAIAVSGGNGSQTKPYVIG